MAHNVHHVSASLLFYYFFLFLCVCAFLFSTSNRYTNTIYVRIPVPITAIDRLWDHVYCSFSFVSGGFCFLKTFIFILYVSESQSLKIVID